MESQNRKNQELLYLLGALPRHMVKHHGTDNLTEFVLHGMCKDGFGITKAAYFMNNTDFDILKGVTGYHHQESYSPIKSHWDEKQQFSASMQDSKFNQEVRNYLEKSFEKGKAASEKEAIAKICHNLGFQDPMYHVWDVKYDNHGLFIFDHPGKEAKHVDDHLYDFLHLLGFCPVY